MHLQYMGSSNPLCNNKQCTYKNYLTKMEPWIAAIRKQIRELESCEDHHPTMRISSSYTEYDSILHKNHVNIADHAYTEVVKR